MGRILRGKPELQPPLAIVLAETRLVFSLVQMPFTLALPLTVKAALYL